jgi:hypothetical protein
MQQIIGFVPILNRRSEERERKDREFKTFKVYIVADLLY